MELVSISINLVCTISRRSNSKIHSVGVNFICYNIYHITRVSAVLGVPGEAAAEPEHPGLHPHPEPLGLRPAVRQRPGREAAEDKLLDTGMARQTSLARRVILV